MIPQIKKILYSTDLSKNSSYVFLYAIDMARRHDAKIVILHAIEPISAYGEVFGVLTGDIKQKKHEEAITFIRKHYRNFAIERRIKLAIHALDLHPKSLFH
jgi:nucleotide-binding universal stress UspA family protein